MALIETGRVTGNLIPFDFDIGYDFAGDGFSAQGTDLGNQSIGGVFHDGLVPVSFSGPFYVQSVTVGNSFCPPAAAGITSTFCGNILLHNAPFSVSIPPPDQATSIVVTEPFTASGHLNPGGGLDIAGQGFLTFTYTSPGCPGFPCSGLRESFLYTFTTVDEPSSWSLMIAAVAALVIGRFWRAFGWR